MSAAIDLLESEIETLQSYLDSSPNEHLSVLEKLVADYREALRVSQADEEAWQSLPRDAHAFCPLGFGHLAKMRWIGDYIRNALRAEKRT